MQTLWSTSHENSNTSVAAYTTGRPHTLGAWELAQSLGTAAAAIQGIP